MKNASGTAVWMLGALLISILVGAGVYFLLISPELDKTSTAQTELESAQELNDLLDTQILAAEAAAKNVDDWYAEIAAIRLDLPPTPEESALSRFLNDTLSKEGLPTLSISYGGVANVEPPANAGSVAAVAEPADSTPADPGASADATATASPAADPSAAPVAPGDTAEAAANSQPVTGLLGMPVTISTAGKPEAVMRFLLDLQTQNTRFFTVTNFDIQRSGTAEAQAARPALEEGDWAIGITGTVFNLFDSELSLPVKEPATTPPYTGESVRNVFAPLTPTG